jgi:hypothetical protein
MADAADYRRKAEDCVRLAEQAADDFHRRNFQQLAAMWSEMADKAEGRVVALNEAADDETLNDALATIRNVQ